MSGAEQVPPTPDLRTLYGELLALQEEQNVHNQRGIELAQRMDGLVAALGECMIAGSNASPAEVPHGEIENSPTPAKELRLGSALLVEADTPLSELEKIAQKNYELPAKIQEIFEPGTAVFQKELGDRVPLQGPPKKRMGLIKRRNPEAIPSFEDDPKAYKRFIKKWGEPHQWTATVRAEQTWDTRDLEYTYSITVVRLGENGTAHLVGYGVDSPPKPGAQLSAGSVHVVCDAARNAVEVTERRDHEKQVFQLGSTPTVLDDKQVFIYNPDKYELEDKGPESTGEIMGVEEGNFTLMWRLKRAASLIPMVESTY